MQAQSPGLLRRPPPDPRLAPILQNGVLVRAVFQDAPYAGDGPDPPPVPQVSLYEFKSRPPADTCDGPRPSLLLVLRLPLQGTT
jgi:hypothetical protein